MANFALPAAWTLSGRRLIQRDLDANDFSHSRRAETNSSVSVRKLRQDFVATVGLSPRTYARVWRFQRLARAAATIDRERDWAALAVQRFPP